MRISANDVDVYWLDEECDVDIDTLVIYCGQEPCPLPTILLDNTEEEAQHIATILSKLGRVHPFMDKDTPIGTKLYRVGNNLLLKLADFHPVTSGNHWLFGYPIVRESLLATTERFNISDIVVLTSSLYSHKETNVLKSDAQFSSKRFSELDEEILPMFAWVCGMLSESVNKIDANFIFFNSTPRKVMSQEMFADGIGLMQFIMPINLKEAQESYNEYESELNDRKTGKDLFTIPDVSENGGMYS